MSMTRERAIQILGCYGSNYCWENGESIPAEAVKEAMGMAIGALRAQEPRVMTLEEVLECDFCWIETYAWHDGDHFEPVLRSMFLDDESGRTFIDKKDDLFCFKDAEYGVTCRCWTACPNEERREATAWPYK